MFKIAEINCPAEVLVSLCWLWKELQMINLYSGTQLSYIHTHTCVYIYIRQNSPYQHNMLETSLSQLKLSHMLLLSAWSTLILTVYTLSHIYFSPSLWRTNFTSISQNHTQKECHVKIQAPKCWHLTVDWT